MLVWQSSSNKILKYKEKFFWRNAGPGLFLLWYCSFFNTFLPNVRISSHENKKSLKSVLFKKIFLIENECKTSYGCLTSTFYQEYFYDKMGLRLFYFLVKICPLKNETSERNGLNMSVNFVKYKYAIHCSWPRYALSSNTLIFYTSVKQQSISTATAWSFFRKIYSWPPCLG